MPKTYFTADTHFSHRNVLKHCNRPFESVHEMNKEIISRWNSKVNPEDIVYHLGDFCLSTKKDLWESLVNQLNGTIYLIRGNHDKKTDRYVALFGWIKDYHELRVQDPEIVKDRSHLIVLSHYAMRVWNKGHWGSFHLYGHSHGGLEEKPWGRSMDVGVDCHDYCPISYQEVKETLLARDWGKK